MRIIDRIEDPSFKCLACKHYKPENKLFSHCYKGHVMKVVHIKAYFAEKFEDKYECYESNR